MGAVEKALELFNKMYNVDCNDDTDSMQYSHAKKCALIAVDEIKEVVSLCIPYKDEKSYIDYWQQVKHEINNL